MPRFLAALCVLAPTVAFADPTNLGVWLGPRIFSQDSPLGYIDDAPAHPMIQNGLELGARVSHKFFPWDWVQPEFELAVSPTHTNAVGGAMEASIFWIEPRVQLRFELAPQRRYLPFLVIGGGSPIDFSSARKTLETGVIGDGYVGGGVRLDTHKGFMLRGDARVAIIPGENHIVRPEFEVGVGIELVLGAKHVAPVTETEPAALADKDGDGIPDQLDKCPDRPEDNDGFEDQDGCPDIDNDGDRVLDIADKCPSEPETYNGYMDEDGCPDTVPPEVDAIRGTIEGLIYADGETAVRDSAMPHLQKLAKLLAAQPSVKIVLVGHTDNQEAKAFASPPAAGQPPPDVDALAVDLAQARAEGVRQALVHLGVPQGRIMVDGVGADGAVADNSTARGRLANRRVEVKLFVPNP